MRRTLTELKANHIAPLLGEYGEILRFSAGENAFLMDNGSRIDCGYCDSERDALRYQGQEYDIIAIDEATQLTEAQFCALKAALRGVRDMPRRMYLTCNPGGVGHGWVKRLFIDGSYREGEDPEDYLFIPASVYDNAALMESDPDYVKRLEALPEGLRAAWLCGRWDVFSGQFFSEFDERRHVVAPVVLPDGARYYCAMDYGLDMLAALFIAVFPDGRAYVYDEIYESGLIVSMAAEKIAAKLRQDMTVIAPADLWSRSKDSGRSISELFSEGGVYLTKITPDRIDGWLALKEWLADADGAPRLRIFQNCANIIRTLPLLLYDPKRHGDAATEPHEITHAPDALRYFASFCRDEKGVSSAKPRRRFGRR